MHSVKLRNYLCGAETWHTRRRRFINKNFILKENTLPVISVGSSSNFILLLYSLHNNSIKIFFFAAKILELCHCVIKTKAINRCVLIQNDRAKRYYIIDWTTHVCGVICYIRDKHSRMHIHNFGEVDLDRNFLNLSLVRAILWRSIRFYLCLLCNVLIISNRILVEQRQKKCNRPLLMSMWVVKLNQMREVKEKNANITLNWLMTRAVLCSHTHIVNCCLEYLTQEKPKNMEINCWCRPSKASSSSSLDVLVFVLSLTTARNDITRKWRLEV